MLRSERYISKDGSIILLVLLVTSVIMSLAYIFWQRSMLYAQYMDERLHYEQQICLLEGAVRYGVMYAAHHYDSLINGIERVLNLDTYAQLMHAEYCLTLKLSSSSSSSTLVLRAQLYLRGNPAHTLCCTIVRAGKRVVINEWNLN